MEFKHVIMHVGLLILAQLAWSPAHTDFVSLPQPSIMHPRCLVGTSKKDTTPLDFEMLKKYLDFRQYAVAEDGGKNGNGQESVEGLLGLGRA